MLLYRYSAIKKYTISNLIEKKNWVADPKSFNDPFEFLTRRAFDFTETGLSFHSPDNIKYKNYIESVTEKYGVVPYTELDQGNALMWSHYGDNHKGMCLVFEVNPNDNPDLFKVKYKRNLPKMNYTKTATAFRENLIKIATIKSRAWKYEHEWREVFTQKNKHADYPGKLTKVIFGCRCPVEDMKIV
ncbi:MAG: DUF2971 domain-containing protein [Crocinitomicaceae bacterium]|nr:DUF2971 domain-containing protein [Crocinitomicaceae bacterium]